MKYSSKVPQNSSGVWLATFFYFHILKYFRTKVENLFLSISSSICYIHITKIVYFIENRGVENFKGQQLANLSPLGGAVGTTELRVHVCQISYT